jgi:hypothetical protein
MNFSKFEVYQVDQTHCLLFIRFYVMEQILIPNPLSISSWDHYDYKHFIVTGSKFQLNLSVKSLDKFDLLRNATQLDRFDANVTLKNDGKTILDLRLWSACGVVSGSVTVTEDTTLDFTSAM